MGGHQDLVQRVQSEDSGSCLEKPAKGSAVRAKRLQNWSCPSSLWDPNVDPLEQHQDEILDDQAISLGLDIWTSWESEFVNFLCSQLTDTLGGKEGWERGLC